MEVLKIKWVKFGNFGKQFLHTQWKTTGILLENISSQLEDLSEPQKIITIEDVFIIF